MEPTRSLEQLTGRRAPPPPRRASCASRDATKPTSSPTSAKWTRAGSMPARPRRPCSPTAPSVLHLSEAEAYLRIAAARASREHPDPPRHARATGRLHLTAIAKLAPHLTPDNRRGRPGAGHPRLEAPGRGARGRVGAPSRCAGAHPEAARAPAHRPCHRRAVRPCPERIAGSSFELRPDAVARTREGPRVARPSRAWVGTKRRRAERPSSVRTESVRPGLPSPRLPRRASSPSPPGATASSSPPAPGCATSSRGSRPSCAPPSPAPTSPPSSKTPSPRSSRGSRPAASDSRRPPARTSRRPGRSPPRATSRPPSAGPCTSGTEAVVASSTSRADGARPATVSSTTTATPWPWVVSTPRRGSRSRAKPTICTWRRSTTVVRPWPGIGGRAPGRRAPGGTT